MHHPARVPRPLSPCPPQPAPHRGPALATSIPLHFSGRRGESATATDQGGYVPGPPHATCCTQNPSPNQAARSRPHQAKASGPHGPPLCPHRTLASAPTWVHPRQRNSLCPGPEWATVTGKAGGCKRGRTLRDSLCEDFLEQVTLQCLSGWGPRGPRRPGRGRGLGEQRDRRLQAQGCDDLDHLSAQSSGGGGGRAHQVLQECRPHLHGLEERSRTPALGTGEAAGKSGRGGGAETVIYHPSHVSCAPAIDLGLGAALLLRSPGAEAARQ